MADADPNANHADPRRGRWVLWGVLAGLIVLLSAGALVQRGVLRALAGSQDLTMIYGGARQLALGGDPYIFEDTYDVFLEAKGEGRPRDPDKFASLYPPFTYAVLSPLGVLDWPTAKRAWLGVNLASAGAVGYWLVRYRPRRRPREEAGVLEGHPDPRRAWPGIAWVVAVWLGCGVLHTSLAFGQLCVLALALMLPVLGPWRAREQWGWLSGKAIGVGVLLALAGAIKLQLLAPVALLLLFTPRRSAVVWGMGFGGLIVAASVWWINDAAPQWLEHWRAQLARFSESGTANPTGENPFTYQLIHLEPWLHRLWPGGTGPAWLGGAAVLGSVLLLAWAIVQTAKWSRRQQSQSENGAALRGGRATAGGDDVLLGLIGLAMVVTLLVAYHRAYDAVVLVLPSLWVIRRLNVSGFNFRLMAAILAICGFMIPGPSLVSTMTQRGVISDGLHESWFWRCVVASNHNFCLIALAVVIFIELRQSIRLAVRKIA